MKVKWKYQNYETQIIFAFVVIIISILIIYNLYSSEHKKSSLKNSFKTWAIISEMSEGTYKIPRTIDFYFLNKKGEKIEILNSDPIDCFTFRKEKDTIYIRYSLTDNYVTEVIHCFWNEKLRDDMNRQLK